MYKKDIIKMLNIDKFSSNKQKNHYRRKARLMFELLYRDELCGEPVQELRHQLNKWCRKMFN